MIPTTSCLPVQPLGFLTGSGFTAASHHLQHPRGSSGAVNSGGGSNVAGVPGGGGGRGGSLAQRIRASGFFGRCKPRNTQLVS